jgi:hypothetical protein
VSIGAEQRAEARVRKGRQKEAAGAADAGLMQIEWSEGKVLTLAGVSTEAEKEVRERRTIFELCFCAGRPRPADCASSSTIELQFTLGRNRKRCAAQDWGIADGHQCDRNF